MKKYILILILLFVTYLTQSQIVVIDSIISQIEKRNPALQQYELKKKAANSFASGAKSWEAPLVGAGLYMLPYKYDKDMGAIMLSATQMIPNKAKQRANEKYMGSMANIEIENRNYKLNQLINLAKIHYYNWIILKKKQVILLESENWMNYILHTSEIKYTMEKEKLTSIYKAKSELFQLKSMQLMNESEIQERRIALNSLQNQSSLIYFDIDTCFQIKDYESHRLDSSKLSNFRSDIKVIDQNIEVARLKMAFENSKLKPDFGIKVDHSFGFGMQTNQFSIMAMMSLPIVPWAAGMFKANAKGINYEIQSMEKEKESMRLEIFNELLSIQNELKYKKALLKLYNEHILPSLQKSYKIALLAYEQNTEELYMVLDAWQSLKIAQLENLNILKELLVKQVEYEKESEQK